MINETLLWKAHLQLHERCAYSRLWRKKYDREGSEYNSALEQGKEMAYNTACDILLAAIIGDEEKLKAFDIYECFGGRNNE